MEVYITNSEYRSEALKARITAINQCAAILAETYSEYEDILSYSALIGPVPLDKFIEDCMSNIKRTAWGVYDDLKNEE